MSVRERLRSYRERWDRYWEEYDQMMAQSPPVPLGIRPMMGDMGSSGVMAQAMTMMAVQSNPWLRLGETSSAAIATMVVADFCETDNIDLSVPVGSRVMVVLKEIPSSGYSHDIPELPSGIKLMGDSFEDQHPQWEPDVEHAVERERRAELGVVGDEAKRGLILLVGGEADDESVLRLLNRRSWVPGDIWSEKTLTLRPTGRG